MRGLRRKIAVLTVASITALIAQQAHAIEYGNIQVIQLNAGNNPANHPTDPGIIISTPQASSGFSVSSASNRGDYKVSLCSESLSACTWGSSCNPSQNDCPA